MTGLDILIGIGRGMEKEKKNSK